MIIAALSLLLAVSSVALLYTTRRCLELMEVVDAFEGAVEKALIVLNEQHEKIDAKTKIEVFSDEPVVKELVNDIFLAREAVLEVAKTLEEEVEDNDKRASET